MNKQKRFQLSPISTSLALAPPGVRASLYRFDDNSDDNRISALCRLNYGFLKGITMSRRSLSQQPQPHQRPRLTCSRDEAESKLKERIKLGDNLRNTQIRTKDEYKQVWDAYSRWVEFNHELLLSLFDTPEVAEQNRDISLGVASNDLAREIEDVRNRLSRKLNTIQSIIDRLPLYQEIGISEASQIFANTVNVLNKNVFIVHGHNNGIKSQVARVLEKLKLNVIILHEQPDSGRTIIEKFEHYANTCSFAVVLLTADDMGYSKDNPGKQEPRARQNVIMELGYFLAKLTKPYVCALLEKGVELPSDYQGMLWKSLEDTSWDLQLAKEIKAAGIEVDLNDL